MIVEELHPGHIKYFLADLGDVVMQIRVVEYWKACPDGIEQLLTNLPLLPDTEAHDGLRTCGEQHHANQQG